LATPGSKRAAAFPIEPSAHHSRVPELRRSIAHNTEDKEDDEQMAQVRCEECEGGECEGVDRSAGNDNAARGKAIQQAADERRASSYSQCGQREGE